MRSKPKTITAYFETDYCLYRDLQPGSIKNLRRSLKAFSKWLTRDPLITELTDEMLSRWVIHLEATLAPKTAHGRRGDVLGIWRDAFDSDKTGKVQMPRRVRRVRVPDPEPDTWGPEDIAAMVSAARTVPGFFRPEYRAWEMVPRALYLEAIIRVAWETGLRRGDLTALRMEQISPDGVVAMAQGKTGTVHVGRLSVETIALLNQLNRNPPLAWPHVKSSAEGGNFWGLNYWIGRIRDMAGVGSEGQLQKIRASAGTNVAIHQPGMETRFLGHTSPKADKWYIDKKRLPRVTVSPQALEIVPCEVKGGAA